MSMEKLSVRQQQVYDYIKQYITEKGFSPSLADIAQGLNLHDSTIVAYVEALKRKGYVQSEYRTARSFRIINPEKVTQKPVTDLHIESRENIQHGEEIIPSAGTKGVLLTQKRRALIKM